MFGSGGNRYVTNVSFKLMYVPAVVQPSLFFVFKEQYFDMATKCRMVMVQLGVARALTPTGSP